MSAVLYVNGVVVATNYFGIPVHPDTQFAVNLGYRPVGSSDVYAGVRLKGELDEISLYSRALASMRDSGDCNQRVLQGNVWAQYSPNRRRASNANNHGRSGSSFHCLRRRHETVELPMEFQRDRYCRRDHKLPCLDKRATGSIWCLCR